jgi:hypothetical protein
MQKKHSSVAVPISMFAEGTHRTRALLFKTLADKLGIASTLDRGNRRSWNVVLLRTTKKRVRLSEARNLKEIGAGVFQLGSC